MSYTLYIWKVIAVIENVGKAEKFDTCIFEVCEFKKKNRNILEIIYILSINDPYEGGNNFESVILFKDLSFCFLIKIISAILRFL